MLQRFKRLLQELDVPANILIDTETFDAPTMPDKSSFAFGNTTIEDIADSANALGTVALCKYEGGSAAEFLQEKFKVPAIVDQHLLVSKILISGCRISVN